MNGLAILIPIALSLGLLGLVAFFWALRSGQFDDMDGAALRIFVDEGDPNAAQAETGKRLPAEPSGKLLRENIRIQGGPPTA